MNILVIGSGGREHAIANALVKSALLKRLFVAPGNPGTAAVAENVDLDAADHAGVIAFCRDNGVAMVVIGPEQPLIGGLSDALRAKDILVFGPSSMAAQLEGSKGFTKDICRDYAIPTAAYARFDAPEPALAYVRETGAPIVVKADGLAAGKGVVVAATVEEAERAIEAMFAGAFGRSGAEVVIEAFMEGEEASFFALCDGTRAVALATAQDHKRAYDGDKGPNTGGMGAYSPAPIVTPDMSAQVMATIIEPTLRAMRDKGAPYSGVLYAGLMLTKDGPQLIEYNARFGDPEAQVILPRLEDDLLVLMLAAARGALPETPPRLSAQTALTVVLAAKNYPGAPLTGTEIKGVEAASAMEGVTITHAGTKIEDGRLLAAGGRVLNVTAMGANAGEARARAYAAVAKIDWPGGFWRSDIGWREVERETAAG